MRRDQIELDPAAEVCARHGRSMSSQKTEPAGDESTGQMTLAPHLLDEAFALLASGEVRAHSADAPANDLQSAACEALSGSGISESDSPACSQLSTAKQRIQRQRRLVDNLSAQLAALDRQRAHVAQLLRDIDAAKLVDRLDA